MTKPLHPGLKPPSIVSRCAVVALFAWPAFSAPALEASRTDPAPGAACVDAAMRADPARSASKWALWSQGTALRGANIYQRRVYPELDGPDFIGPGPLGPPYTQEDFNRLAALGANYVNISHTGLFTEDPPYQLDPAVRDNLDRLLGYAANAHLYAVIAFRTGPGRSEFTFFLGQDWYPPSYINEQVWKSQEAQDAWAAMWAATAERYKDNPVVAGYDLMVEPNANDYWLGLWDAAEFHDAYGGTLYDWNRFFPSIVAAIRAEDASTPILVGAGSYGAVDWLPWLQPVDDPRTLYTVHQYAPHVYTHQDPYTEGFTYPGFFDTDYDETPEAFNPAWLADLLGTVDEFIAGHGVTMAVNEFGGKRWAPGIGAFIGDEMDAFEERGLNHALWIWDPAWEPMQTQNDDFNFLHGDDPENHSDLSSSPLIDAILEHWGRNSARPGGSSHTRPVSPP